MKKKYTKALKQFSLKLPLSYELIRVGKSIMGYEALKQNLAKDEEVESEVRYTYKSNEFVVINHYNRIKKAYSRNKEQGVTDYILWLNRNNKKLQEQFKDMELQQVDENILNIAAKGAKVFGVL